MHMYWICFTIILYRTIGGLALKHFTCVLTWKFRFVTALQKLLNIKHTQTQTYIHHTHTPIYQMHISVFWNWKFPNGINQSYQFICYKSNQFLYGLYSMWNLCMHRHSTFEWTQSNGSDARGMKTMRHIRQIMCPKNKRAGAFKCNIMPRKPGWQDFIKNASHRFVQIREMACSFNKW